MAPTTCGAEAEPAGGGEQREAQRDDDRGADREPERTVEVQLGEDEEREHGDSRPRPPAGTG